MPATINGGAAAPGPVTPTSDNAHLAVGAVFKGQGETDNPDCADYLAAVETFADRVGAPQ